MPVADELQFICMKGEGEIFPACLRTLLLLLPLEDSHRGEDSLVGAGPPVSHLVGHWAPVLWESGCGFCILHRLWETLREEGDLWMVHTLSRSGVREVFLRTLFLERFWEDLLATCLVGGPRDGLGGTCLLVVMEVLSATYLLAFLWEVLVATYL